MAETPLEIINQSSRATAQLFSTINQSIAQAASNEISAANAASGIIKNTFQAREFQRLNDAQIRSTILTDQFRVNQEAREQAKFQMEQQLVPLRIQQEQLRTQYEINRLASQEFEKSRLQAETYINDINAPIISDAFRKSYETGDFSFLAEADQILAKGKQQILSGKSLDEVNAMIGREYRSLVTRPRPEAKIEYSPSNTETIRRLVGDEAAQAYELEHNPNYDAMKKSRRANILLSGTPSQVAAEIEKIPDFEEKVKAQKAYSELQATEEQIKVYDSLLKKFVDPFTGQPKTGVAVDVPGAEPLPSGEPTQFKNLGAKQKEELVRKLESNLVKSIQRQQQIVQAIQTGSDIPEEPEVEVETEPITGAAGQTSTPTLPVGGIPEESLDAVEKAATDPNLSTSESTVLQSRETLKEQRAERQKLSLVDRINQSDEGLDKPAQSLSKVLNAIRIPAHALDADEFTLFGERFDPSPRRDFEPSKINLNEKVAREVGRLSQEERDILLERLIDISESDKELLMFTRAEGGLVSRIQEESDINKKNNMKNILLERLLQGAIIKAVD